MGHVNVNFPLLHKCCDKSGAASHQTLIAMKSFDVPSANQSKQITVSPSVQSSSSKIHPTFWLWDKCKWISSCLRGRTGYHISECTCETGILCVTHTILKWKGWTGCLHSELPKRLLSSEGIRKMFFICRSCVHTNLALFTTWNNDQDKRAASSGQWGR